MIAPNAVRHAELKIISMLITRLCIFIACNAFLANLLPNETLLEKHPNWRIAYEFLIFFVCLFGISWRARRPSLNIPMMGFTAQREDKVLRMARHRWRNHQETKQLKREL